MKRKSKSSWCSRKRASKDVASAEDWHPTINGLIHVSLIEYNPEEGAGLWRVHVCGDDDSYMELDAQDESRARYVFDRITHLTTKDEMRALGLIWCA